MEIAKNDLREF